MSVRASDVNELSPIRKPTGFTLIELIAVMGIIVAMSLIVMGGFRGMMNSIAQRAGVDALHKAVTLCRQYATIDGKETYIWITGFDTYVICRKEGKLDGPIHGFGTLTQKAGFYFKDSSDNYQAFWVSDQYVDMGNTADFASIENDSEGQRATGEIMKEKKYDGGLVFDFDNSKVARIRFPPWFNPVEECWVFGIMGPAKEDSPPSGFRAGCEYGWMIGQEYQLPKGYVFDDDGSMYDYSSSGEFVKGNRISFAPDGCLNDAGEANGMLRLKKLDTGQTPYVKVNEDGSIDRNYDEK